MPLEVNKEFSEKITHSKFKIAVKNVSHPKFHFVLSEFQDGCNQYGVFKIAKAVKTSNAHTHVIIDSILKKSFSKKKNFIKWPIRQF